METEIERTYYPNGQLWSEQPHVDGKPHGMEKWWFPSGQLGSEYTYVDGVLHGMGKRWWQDGGIGEFYLYNQGELVATFYPINKTQKTQKWKLK
jgi:antitoxin component YwqK of YwqJK toxin-antitoxin module